MGTGGQHRHDDDMAGKNVEQRQWTHNVVAGAEHKGRSEPPIVEHARICMLGHLRHAGGAAGVEIGRDPVFLLILKGQPVGRLLEQLPIEMHYIA